MSIFDLRMYVETMLPWWSPFAVAFVLIAFTIWDVFKLWRRNRG